MADSVVCPFCSTGFNASNDILGNCPHCDIPHHLECWQENAGCTTLGCPANPQSRGGARGGIQLTNLRFPSGQRVVSAPPPASYMPPPAAVPSAKTPIIVPAPQPNPPRRWRTMTMILFAVVGFGLAAISGVFDSTGQGVPQTGANSAMLTMTAAARERQSGQGVAPTATNTVGRGAPTSIPPSTQAPSPTRTRTSAPTRTPRPSQTPAGGGGQILFFANRSGNWDLYRVDPNGSSTPEQLTRTSQSEVLPYGSPDCQRLAFYADYDGDGEIYTMTASGGDVRQLTHNRVQDFWPAWSPDGTLIAYMSVPGSYGDIFLMTPGGSVTRQLTTDPAEDWSPTWSPDSQQIAFVSNRDGDAEIYVMTIATGSLRQLTNNRSVVDEAPAWSPDGRQIAFASNRDGDAEISVMDTRGGNVQQLTRNNNGDWFPNWSPDGNQLVFASNRRGTTELYIMDIDGRGTRQITTNMQDARSPVWQDCNN